jgi:hypothetical protein
MINYVFECSDNDGYDFSEFMYAYIYHTNRSFDKFNMTKKGLYIITYIKNKLLYIMASHKLILISNRDFSNLHLYFINFFM